jgi:hypothetical protein
MYFLPWWTADARATSHEGVAVRDLERAHGPKRGGRRAIPLTCGLRGGADACRGEKDAQELVRCVRLNLDCADVCDAAGRILTRQTAPDLELLRATIETCAAACRVCGQECERHAAHHDHCRICADACRRCEQACNDLEA